ncbi:dihydrofolate reductase family protein [Dactylosporangium matsuzakiense]|uniref:Deaminase reductase n=1 Tax=Dactylosporangium matsuzakiense TaxID=53360 RepID=A0A9W6NPR2_9ACTN|nr:dihydrofolate reductase family protein [Dactylosporangium matsuzakiense]UWZ41021.1 dihydrofolate reductase family protein [Dactylosporangium matsuzakiense]GLL04769.1 deaminase reductase [Dactylosporangium matsuzakiense]
MRNVVLYQLMSLDGVAEEPGNWMFDADAGVFDNLARVIERQDAVLLGRGTYDYWSGYWPTADVEPFASFINGTTKHVFTATRPATAWSNSVFVDTPAAAYVAALKAGDGGDIGIHGSIALAQSLLNAGLVDELRLVVAPALAGTGRKLFAGQDALRRLDLVEVHGTTGGNVLLTYRVPGQ